MKILIITNLYKNRKEPGKAQYHTQQFKALSEISDIKIVSPIPHFKFYKKYVPLEDEIDGIKVYYPRYLVIPKILRSLYWMFYYVGVIGCVRKIRESFDLDVILSIWAYPDGVASYFIGKSVKKPVVIGALGSDINLCQKCFFRKKLIAKAMQECAKVVAVSEDLKNKIVEMGVSEGKVSVLHNGVDSLYFKSMDRHQCRKELGLPLDKKIILHIGNHAHVKGVDILIDAVKGISEEYCVVMVGDGALSSKLQQTVKDGNYKAEVLFPGRKSHDEIPKWINAANVFCLPSRNEGHPNVLLESLACGVPVVATKVGGIPEIIANEALGILVESGDTAGLKDAIIKATQKEWPKEKIVAYASGWSWDDNAGKLKDIIEIAISCKQKLKGKSKK